MALATSITAFAGTWKLDAKGWWWDNGNGTWPAGCWQWCDGNGDGIAECYYFDANGYCQLGGTTPDGYTVNNDGAWTVNGVVQTKVSANTGSVTTDSSASQQSGAYESNGGSEKNADRARQLKEKGFYYYTTSADGKYLVYSTEHSSINVPKRYKELFESLDIEYYTSNLDESEVSELVFDLVNMVREHDGVNALSHDEGLCEVAQARAVDITEVQSHSKRPSGESAVSLYKEYGFTKGYGEINMYGSSTAAGIVAGWLASPEHKKIMLKESYNYGEFGVADKNCYDYAYYYCVGSLIK